MSESECDHLLTYTTEMTGLNGLYIRCRECLEYWSLEEAYKDFAQRYVIGMDEPDDWGYDENGNVVDLR